VQLLSRDLLFSRRACRAQEKQVTGASRCCCYRNHGAITVARVSQSTVTLEKFGPAAALLGDIDILCFFFDHHEESEP
jgi:hypothetical protein